MRGNAFFPNPHPPRQPRPSAGTSILCGDTTSCGTSAEIRTEYDYLGSTLLPTAMRQVDSSTGAAITLTTAFTYDAAGRLLSTDGPLAGSDDATYARYDTYGRKTWEIGARGPNGLRIATRTTYRDSDDRPIYSETGTLPDAASTTLTVFSRTDLAYDSRRNPVRAAVSGAGATLSVTDKSFDDQGRLECTATRMNPSLFPLNGTGGSLPASACTLGTEGSAGPDRITRNFYDAAGQRLQSREGVGTAIEAAEATWSYTANGKVATMVDANGNRADLHYDGHDRQDRWTFPSTTRAAAFNDATQATALASAGAANASDYEEYLYDPNGNRISLRKRDGRHIALAYDHLNRVMAKTYPDGGATSVYYGYDLRNLQLSARFASQSGEGISNSFDGFGRLVSSANSMGGTTRTLSYQYDRNGNRVRITHPDGSYFVTDYDGLNRPFQIRQNGATVMAYMGYANHGGISGISLANGTTTQWGYDGAQRMSALLHGLAGTANDALWVYGRNPAGQIVSETRDNDLYAWTGHYAVNRAYATSGLNQYSAAGSATFGYDANGNLTSDGSNTFVYDIENRLVGRSGSVTLVYDPLGRLFQVSSTTGPTTQFLYDGDALVGEYVSGALTHRYVHNVGAEVPLLDYHGSGLGQPYYLHADHQGSIVAISDPWGAASAINTYDEYGIPGAANTGRFQYTGQAWLAELGMYYYKARIYSPTLGRFMQTDPIGYDDQFNLYEYVGDDPVNSTDPTGLCRTPCPWETAREGLAAAGARSDLTGSTVVGGVGAAHDAIERTAHALGASVRELRPVHVIGRGLSALSGMLRYNELRQEGRSMTSSLAGAVVGEGTTLTFTETGAAAGTIAEPGLGTVVGGVLGFGLDQISNASDRLASVVSGTVTWVENGGPHVLANQVAAAAYRHMMGTETYRRLYGE